MRRRLYFMLPDVDHCKQLVAELQNAGMPERDIHVVARNDIPLENLPKASVLQKTELTYGLELGVGVGSIAGMLGGVLAVTFPPAGLVLGGGAVIATTLAGASFGSVVSLLIARDIPNHELQTFQTGIAQGQTLLILDIPTPQIDEITQLIKNTHPEAQIGVVKAAKARCD
ncbi:membrane protein [Candidatus Thiomargarita nelsonii]|uniref:Membrane protein n=1 Tax=Candidatus Thiomargarita nelsonii TaxID=1003181 RepID=A0A0A6PDW0_9GAMM|nr:membrane protein [Candidatus Thiomargarita nelsonii]